MRKCGLFGWREFTEQMEKSGCECIGCVEGSLVDNVLYEAPDGQIVIALEEYLNAWSSALNVRVARTERDRNKLLAEFEALEALNSVEEETENINEQEEPAA